MTISVLSFTGCPIERYDIPFSSKISATSFLITHLDYYSRILAEKKLYSVLFIQAPTDLIVNPPDVFEKHISRRVVSIPPAEIS
ncbi:MAG: hypothetical protein MZV63_24075 [Marinilabiliales bacterium]|nr:hypothetical protein [Marinilabiliales bacterium]